MNKFLIGIGFSLAAMSAASAADMPVSVNKAPASYIVQLPWQGLYVGIHGGGGWGNIESGLNLAPIGFGDPQPDGYVIGGHVGYGWQWSSFYAGMEVDYDFANLKDSQLTSLVGSDLTLNSKIDSLASVRARIGFTIIPELLLYGTGGFAFNHSEITIASALAGISATADTNNFGWVAGAGAEYMITRNIVAGIEYLHYDFGHNAHTFQLNLVPVPIFEVNANENVDVIKGRLSYKFSN